MAKQTQPSSYVYKKNYMLVQIGTLQHGKLRRLSEEHGLSIRSLVEYIVSNALSDEERTNEICQVLQNRQQEINIASALMRTEKLIAEEEAKFAVRLQALRNRKEELEAKSSERR